MAKSTKSGVFWRADWFAGVVVVFAALAVNWTTDSIGAMERRFYDFASTSNAQQPSDRVAVIAIDDQSIANLGRWPWPRDIHAKLIDQLSAAKAKTIVQTVFFFEPQVDPGLAFIRKMKSAIGTQVDASAATEQLSKIISDAEIALDTDAVLAASMKKAGNVLIPSFFVLGDQRGKPDNPLPAFALTSAIDDPNGFSISAVRAQEPIESIGEASAGVGHLNPDQDADGAVRMEPLLVNYYGKAVPSMALLAASKSLNLAPADIRLNFGDSVQIGKLKIKTDELARMSPQF